jgi:hypothetical protein
LLGNDKFSFEGLQTCVQKATVKRISGKVLLIQDTSDVNFNEYKKTEGLGYGSEHNLGIKIHSGIAVQPDGVTLGLLAQKYETRAERKDGRTKEERQRRPIEEKESDRWIETLRESMKRLPPEAEPITVCGREGVFYELYAAARTLEADFVIRVIHDRRSDLAALRAEENDALSCPCRGTLPRLFRGWRHVCKGGAGGGFRGGLARPMFARFDVGIHAMALRDEAGDAKFHQGTTPIPWDTIVENMEIKQVRPAARFSSVRSVFPRCAAKAAGLTGASGIIDGEYLATERNHAAGDRRVSRSIRHRPG